jgi:hypothetical protein
MQHASSYLAPQVSLLENPQYGMPKNFTPCQVSPAMSTLPPKSETALVLSPSMVEPLDSIHTSAIPSRTNELDNFVYSYQIVAYNTPIPPMGQESHTVRCLILILTNLMQ